MADQYNPVGRVVAKLFNCRGDLGGIVVGPRPTAYQNEIDAVAALPY
jgi:hypothetical protein